MPVIDVRNLPRYAAQIPEWEVVDNHHLRRVVKTKAFADGLKLVNRIGAIAEREGHHPDLVLKWGRVRIEVWTHAVDGLTDNDFILAAKIDRLLRSRKTPR